MFPVFRAVYSVDGNCFFLKIEKYSHQFIFYNRKFHKIMFPDIMAGYSLDRITFSLRLYRPRHNTKNKVFKFHIRFEA